MLNSLDASVVANDLRKLGCNIIPIMPGTKMPYEGADVMGWKKDGCTINILPDYSIAMLHGPKGKTWASDFDDHSILKDLMIDEKNLKDLTVIKTPKQGHHIIWGLDVNDAPPKDTSFIDSKGRKIDIRAKGYTLLPPSVHPQEELGRYQFLHQNGFKVMKWSNFLSVINAKGFFSHDDKEEVGTKGKKYQYAELLVGKFTRGERRKKQKSLYIQKRGLGSSEEEATKEVARINVTCLPPFSDNEFNANIESAESFFNNIVKESIPFNANSEPIKKRTLYTLANLLMDEYTFISHVSKEIYFYGNGTYIPHGKELIHTKCRKYWEEINMETKSVTEIVNIIRDKKIVIPNNQNQEMFNLDYNKIIVTNGVYDLKTDTFSGHDSEILSTIKHPIYYDDTKECPKFDKFLESCFDGDNIRITQVLEMMALCFIKYYIIQKGYVNYGIGSNGKTTFLNILRNMLGIYNTCSIPMQQFQNSTFLGHELRGKCANISADGGVDPITKTGLIKGVLGGDAIRCEQKYHNPFDIIPFVTLIFTFNELPSVTDSSDGFARKIQPIHWNKQFYGDKRDNNVEQLAFDTDERSGIFNKLIPIMQRLIKTRKLSFESSVEHTKAIWLSRSDSFFRFRNKKLSKSVKYEIEVGELMKEYEKYCENVGMTAFKKRLVNEAIIQWMGTDTRIKKRDKDGNHVRMWQGFTVSSLLNDGNKTIDGIDDDIDNTDKIDDSNIVGKMEYKHNYRTEPDE